MRDRSGISTPRLSNPLRRNGGMIAGGNGYSLAALDALEPLRHHSCGHAGLDQATGGGFAPGSVWTLAAPAGAGATTFAVQAAVAASRTRRVILANGHMATHLLRDRVLSAADALGVDDAARGRVLLASWAALPDWERDGWDSDCQASDLLVLDTLDEMWRPPAWPGTTEQRLRRMRWFPEIAQRHNVGLLLTARVEPDCDFDEAWRRHWAHEVFADIADVRIELRRSAEADLHLRAYVRGLGWWSSDAVLAGADRAVLRCIGRPG